MQEDNSNEKNGLAGTIASSAVGLVLSVAMSYMHLYKNLILGIIIPLYLVMLVREIKHKRIINIVILIITIIFCAILIIFGEKNYVQNEIPENVERAELEIDLSKMLLKYSDDHGIKELKTEINDELVPEEIKFESYDYDVTIDDWKMEDGKVIISGVPVGNCGIELKFENYDLISEKCKLNKKDLENGKWKKELILQEEGDYKNFEIQLVDSYGNSLSEKRCDIYVDGYNDKITDAVTDSDGKITYSFTGKIDDIICLVLYTGENSYNKMIDISSNSSLIKVEYEDVLSEKTVKDNEHKQELEKLKADSSNQEKMEMQENPRKLLQNENLDMGSLKTEGTLITEWEDALSQDEQEKNINITLSENGGVWIEFIHQNLTSDNQAWKIMVSDTNGDVQMEFTSLMSKENTVSQFVGLAAGNYIVTVKSYSSFSDAPYHVRIFQNQKANYDMEPNGETLTANKFHELKNNEVQTFYGNLTDSNDIDYYSFELIKKGVIAFDFKHENFTNDCNGWYISIKNSDSEELCYFRVSWQATQTGSPNIGLEAGKYYIQIGNYGSLNREPYALSLVWHESDYWESEFNNAILNADPLIVGYYQHGSLMSGDDVDYYMFQCEKTGTYRLTFEHENLTQDDVGWYIDVLDKDSDKVLDERVQSRWNETTVSKSVRLTQGNTYYILVSGSYYSSNADYKFKLEE